MNGRSRKGLSLFEVVIFIFLISLVMIALVQLSVVSIRNTVQDQRKVLAAHYADEAIEWIRGEKEENFTAFATAVAPPSGAGSKSFCLQNNFPNNLDAGAACSSSPCNTGECPYNMGTSPQSTFRRYASFSCLNEGIKAVVTTEWKDGANIRSVPVSTVLSPSETEFVIPAGCAPSPTVVITSADGGGILPSQTTYNTTSNSVDLSGSASDDIGVVSVDWTNDRGGSGMASGTTNWNINNISLQGGINNIIVTARDIDGNTGTDSLSATYTSSPPTINITSPTIDPTYNTSSSSLTVTGSASDDIGVVSVDWTNDRGGSGMATGTTNWEFGPITLQVGINVITVSARDTNGNTANDVLTVDYTSPPPLVAITSPTSNATYNTSNNIVNLAGTASDDTGVVDVSWVNDRGGSGMASGTTSWTVNNINLQTGANVITVTARDIDGNTANDVITVNTLVCKTYTASFDFPINDYQTTAHVLNVPDNLLLESVTIYGLEIQHTYDGDLEAYLDFPGRPSVTLFNSVGGSGDNFSTTGFADSASQLITAGVAPFPGQWRAVNESGIVQSLNVPHVGRTSQGAWTFRIYDHGPADSGRFQAWGLGLCGY